MWSVRNILLTPVVLFVRLPILLPLWILEHIGYWAGELGLWISDRLPGYVPNTYDESRYLKER